ncbi:MAG: RNB domain-containing ribonuclease [Deltaproteobacteria bacterium]|nr:RNB domain-containing ribonuclease [Deltaproteobacteria bacterium]
MTQQMSHDIPAGSVVEFFESKEILCGVCLAVKAHRLNVLTENNREMSLSESRLLHVGNRPLDIAAGRDPLVQELTKIASLRRNLMGQVRIEELWSLLEGESEGFDAGELAEFVFSESITDHHVSAVQRVLLQDRLFFQFKDAKFYARSAEKVELRRLELEKEEARTLRLKQGADWLHAVWNRKARSMLPVEEEKQLIEDLKAFCLFGQEAPEAGLLKDMFRTAAIPASSQSAFRILVRLGIWRENENLHLLEHGFSPDFPEAAVDRAKAVVSSGNPPNRDLNHRRNLDELHAFTVDSPLTRDYDDALSLRVLSDGLFEVGVHIADAAEFVLRGDAIDREAEARASSIYLPDERIAMIPTELSEGICSLRAGEKRLALSFLFCIDSSGMVQQEEIVPSIIRVREQLSYQDVNERIESDESLRTLFELASKLRAARVSQGAVILPLPELQVYVNPAGMIHIYRYEKEMPSQIMVSEWMIAANRAAAAYLARLTIPAIFRSQAECRPETDLTQSQHELFRIYRQRRLFARAELDTRPQTHCSLGLPSYTTVTSPLRRYMDLVVQRLLKHALATQEPLYSEEELQQLITRLNTTQAKVFLVQRKWTRYWILKYLEQEDIHTLNALVLDQNDRFAHLLLPDFLIETNVALPEKAKLPKGEMIRVKLERINPREDVLRVALPDLPKSAETSQSDGRSGTG